MSRKTTRKNKASRRGGKRKNAGRKKTPGVEIATISISGGADLLEMVTDAAHAAGMGRGEWLLRKAFPGLYEVLDKGA